jgi:sugar fermentation stimulation protein A
MQTYKGYELPPLIQGKLIKRYKRFLADVELSDGSIVTAHCPNSGSMRGCADPGVPVWISKSDNPKRKLKFTWEVLRTKDSYIGINTMVPNRLVKQSIEAGLVEELSQYTKVRSEVKTSDHTRLDLMLEDESGNRCYVEIKNCTLVEKGVAMFPDAVTTRGQKHLEELVMLKEQGHEAVIFYLIQRMDAECFTPAAAIDPVYAEKLAWAVARGVRIITRDAVLDPDSSPGIIGLRRSVPVRL